jgi:N-acetylmuramic acid 6-phosphate etherase
MAQSNSDLPDRSHLQTEHRLAESMELDRLPIEKAVELMNAQDAVAVNAVAKEREAVVRAVERVARAFEAGGRLIYVGAGTSGRLGVLDASECPPTFGADHRMVQGIIAGGPEAMFRSQEGAEDREADGAKAVDEKNVTEDDVVMGIAAGGTTPFVRGALVRAAEIGAGTIFLCCVQPTSKEAPAEIVIRPLTGAEVLTGSTRLKAGTATKLVLNQITTLAMVRIGKVYENLMVDLRASNQKLADRAARIVAAIAGVSRGQAMDLLQAAGGEVKTAVVMQVRNLDACEARAAVAKSRGVLRDAMNQA